MPTLREIGDKIVRVNSGHDSNLQQDLVLRETAKYPRKFYNTEAWHVHVGAAIYGAIFGVVTGFVIVPLRVFLTDASLPPHYAVVSGFSVLFIMVALRRGLIGRLPFLGPQVKAYRRALLRKTIETAQKQLAKMTPATAAE